MLNVRDFGAIGNGTADDTAAFQSTIDQAALTNGDRIKVPVGTFQVSQLRMKTGVILEGDGRGTAMRAVAGSTQHMIVNDVPDVRWTAIQDMVLNGQKASQTSPIDAINYDSSGIPTSDRNHRFENLYVINWSGNGINLGPQTGSSKIDTCYIVFCDGCGLLLNSYDLFVDSTWVGQSGLAGVRILAGSNRLLGVKSFWSGRIDPAQGDNFHITARGNHLIGPESQDGARHGFYLDHCVDVYIAGASCDSNHAVDFQLDGCSNCRIDGNVADSGRGNQTAIAGFANSPSGNLINVVYDPNALVPGSPPVSGSIGGNEVHVGIKAAH